MCFRRVFTALLPVLAGCMRILDTSVSCDQVRTCNISQFVLSVLHLLLLEMGRRDSIRRGGGGDGEEGRWSGKPVEVIIAA